MRWFKHMTAASRDEKLMLVRDEFGIEGYGVYWLILEAIAEKYESQKTDPEITFSVKNWRKILEISPKKLRNFLTFSEKIKLFSVVFEGSMITVRCDNLVKFRDEYTVKQTRASRKTPDKLRTNSDHSVSVSDSVSVSAKEINNYDILRDSYIDPDTGEEVFLP